MELQLKVQDIFLKMDLSNQKVDVQAKEYILLYKKKQKVLQKIRKDMEELKEVFLFV